MTRTFDVLSGAVDNEVIAEAVEDVAQSNIDLAALVGRLNDIDARINKLEEALNKSLVAQTEAPAEAAEISEEESAEEDNPTDNPDTDEKENEV